MPTKREKKLLDLARYWQDKYFMEAWQHLKAIEDHTKTLKKTNNQLDKILKEMKNV